LLGKTDSARAGMRGASFCIRRGFPFIHVTSFIIILCLILLIAFKRGSKNFLCKHFSQLNTHQIDTH
jgi:hypothetical protein